jgi:hypothetical protein
LLVIYTSVSSSTTTVMLCVYHNARYTLGDSRTCAATLGLGLGYKLLTPSHCTDRMLWAGLALGRGHTDRMLAAFIYLFIYEMRC